MRRMGNADSTPVVSQTKSLVQVIGGDAEGARQTQEKFARECPVISQLTSAAQAISGDDESAKETENQFKSAMLNLVDDVPVVGHLKGALHYEFGDKEAGDKAMKTASRAIGAMAGGAGGFLVGGPVGAVAGGVAGGAAMDGITTGVDSLIHHKFRPSGYVEAITDVADNPTPGGVFDLAFMPVSDGLGHD